MVSDYREIRPQVSPHILLSPGYGYFAAQARFADYMGPNLGRTQGQYFQGDHHQQSPCPHLQSHPHHFHLPCAHDMDEAIRREIEKERIREEIVMFEIMRRRELEVEVRREMMMERELALQRGSNGFPFSSPLVMGFKTPMRPPLMETRAEGRSLEERIMLSLADRDRLNGRRESGGLEHLPFRRGSSDIRISEVEPVSEGSKDKEKIILMRGSSDVKISEFKPASEGSKEKAKIIFLVKPNENISGVKREASRVDAGVSPSDGNLKKKAKKEWSCALCQVSATSEQGLNEHLQGKKHKAKEAALRAQKAGNNYSIGLFPKKPAKVIEVPGVAGRGTENEVKLASESLPFNKTGGASSNADDLPQLQEKLNVDNLKKDEEPVVDQKVQKSKNRMKKKYSFWCELCKVGTLSERTMNNHLNGKKHNRRQPVSYKSCEIGQSDEKDGATDELVDETMGKDVDEPVEETVAEDVGTVDEFVEETVEETMAEDDGTVDEPVEEETVVEDSSKLDDDLTKVNVADEPKGSGLPVSRIQPLGRQFNNIQYHIDLSSV